MGALKGKVALVAGATRGAGRGIACMLGEAGAAVYCSGRSTREHPCTSGFYAGRPETIDETAEMVTRYGGKGIAVRTDHLVPEQVEALVDRVRREQGRLDVLVNDISEGERHEWKPFWKVDIEKGFRMLRSALHSHIITSRYAVPLMLEHRGGLVAEIGDGDTLDYRATLFYDLVKISVSRLAFAMAEDLHKHGIAAIAITPGFMRTEAILDHFGVTEANWREGGKKDPNFLASETPFFVGRAIAAVAQDPRRMEKSGGLYSSWGLAREYGFTDIDGSQPDWSQQVDIEAHFRALSKTSFRWTISRWETAK
ncbi:Dehydrogenase/reductase (SDR family) member [Candidatus Sulfopaludibacter sp. SbA4]|nr:Dehydrogenase/reductase (SDR family) member [Candidatus Sulfopaludibacter sp. SbA4]